MKKLLSILLLSVIMLVSVSVITNAASDEQKKSADILYELGLFKGTGFDKNGKPIYELDRGATRHEAITMLVRLLGKEVESQAIPWTTPFTDLADWAKPYVGYAYANKLAGGTSKTTFSGNEPVSATQYLTFVLRALGYEDEKDFQWDKAWVLSDSLGITDEKYNEKNNKVTRGDIVSISEKALSTKMKGTDKKLIEKLIEGNVVSSEKAMKVGLVDSCNIKLPTLPAQVNHITIDDDGSTKKSILTVNKIEYVIEPNKYNKNLTYDITLKFNYKFNSTEHFSVTKDGLTCGNGNIYVALYKGDELVQSKILTQEKIFVGSSYTVTYKNIFTVKPGDYSIRLQNHVYDHRMWSISYQGTYYDIP